MRVHSCLESIRTHGGEFPAAARFERGRQLLVTDGMRTGVRSDVTETKHVQHPARTCHRRQTRDVISPAHRCRTSGTARNRAPSQTLGPDGPDATHRQPRSQRVCRELRPFAARLTLRSQPHRLPQRAAQRRRRTGRSRPSRIPHRAPRRRISVRPPDAPAPAADAQGPRAAGHRGTTHPRAAPPAARDSSVAARHTDRRHGLRSARKFRPFPPPG